MCGIFGFATKIRVNPKEAEATAKCLFRFSESRGKESAGLALLSKNEIAVFKQPIRASALIKNEVVKSLLGRLDGQDGVAFIGHARLVTNGTAEKNINNHPVIKDGLVGVHNGIIVNDDTVWKQFSELKKAYDVDTELILSLAGLFLKNADLADAIRSTFKALKGSASVALFFENFDCLALATSTGSLYYCLSDDDDIFVFASEKHILEILLKKNFAGKLLKKDSIKQLRAGRGIIFNFARPQTALFSFTDNTAVEINKRNIPLKIKNLSPPENNLLKNFSPVEAGYIDEAFVQRAKEAIGNIRRCTRCVLPATMPFIDFDENGACNYCRDYKKIEIKGEKKLLKDIGPYRKSKEETDCLFPLSGGRDSSYGLHYIKKVLGLNPITYSYDWGMLTDLARRNQARMCGSLGVEHIVVSADIAKKRRNIKKNILAWLKNPDLGMIPLFMAGDKQYFYYTSKLAKQLRLPLAVYSENQLEKTDFKTGFCHIRSKDLKNIHTLKPADKINLGLYYLGQFLKNPLYINSSILDTLGGYVSHYIMPHNFLFLYQYVKWDEDKVANTLIDEYDWETAPDTKSTWRIGDGTAPFYNYIYWTVAGFSENDTFRSNQIREGMIAREKALELVNRENLPRCESMRWYFDAVGLDMREAIKKINQIPKLYPTNL